ncbi:MAG: hypothetical protein R2745_15390 [Vicinamibacterales bacterium]
MTLLSLVAAGCGKDNPTSPTTTDTTTTTTVADPAVSENFSGTLPVGGYRFYSFDVPTNGTVTATLNAVGGGPVPTTVWVGLGVGVPDGTDCPTDLSLNTQSGEGPHISTTLAPGTHCVRVYDIGNLASPAPFAVTIGHP